MASHLFYYQLALLAILWLFVMLHVTWSKPGLTTPPVPAQPKRKRSSEPKSFAGLTHKPYGQNIQTYCFIIGCQLAMSHVAS